ncbi:MAG TPA: hypothetical protein DCQ98_13505 [Planctomycetaceae bacterium]|nr:hypothetical protein [Planctomycetaceae bacterium]
MRHAIRSPMANRKAAPHSAQRIDVRPKRTERLAVPCGVPSTEVTRRRESVRRNRGSVVIPCVIERLLPQRKRQASLRERRSLPESTSRRSWCAMSDRHDGTAARRELRQRRSASGSRGGVVYSDFILGAPQERQGGGETGSPPPTSEAIDPRQR